MRSMRKVAAKGIPVYAMLLFIFLISIVPVFAVGFFSNIYGLRVSEGYIADTLVSEVTYVAQELNNALSVLRGLLIDNRNDSDVIRYSWGNESHLSTYEFFQTSVRVQSRIYTSAARSNIVNDITFYFPGIRRKVNSATGQDPMTDNDMAIILDMQSMRSTLYRDPEGGLTLYVNNIAYSGDKLTGICMLANLSNEKIEKLMRMFIQRPESETMLLIDVDSGKVLIQTKEYEPEYADAIVRTLQNQEIGSGRFIPDDAGILAAYAGTMDKGIVLVKMRERDSGLSAGNWFAYWLMIIAGVAVVCGFLYAFFVRNMIKRPIAEMMTAFERVESGRLDVKSHGFTGLEFNVLFNRFEKMVRRLSDLINREYRQQLLLKDAQYKLLQMQINPHFMYNTYFIMNSLIYTEDYESAEKLSRLLGVFLEYISHDKASDVPLVREVKHTTAYAEIQQIRFSRTVTIGISPLPPGAETIMVPKLILQPLVENAFEHGIKGMESARIEVKFTLDHDVLTITVDDNGSIDDEGISSINQLLSGASEEDGVALTNIHSRLRIFFGGRSGLTASRSPLGGLRICMRMEGVSKGHV